MCHFAKTEAVNSKKPVTITGDSQLARILQLDISKDEKCQILMPIGVFTGVYLGLKNEEDLFIDFNSKIKEGQAVITLKDGVEELVIGEGPEFDIINEENLRGIKKTISNILKEKVPCLKTIKMRSQRYCKMADESSISNASICSSAEKIDG